MNIKLFCPFLLCGLLILATSVAVAGGGVYVVKIEVENARSVKFGKDVGPKLVSLKIKPFKDCLDFTKSKTSGGEGHFNGVFHMLTLTSPQPVEVELIQDVICGNQDDCVANVDINYYTNSELRIGAVGEGMGRLKGPVSAKSFTGRIPRFSEACETGEVSATGAASTPEARRFLKEIGVDINATRSLELLQGRQPIFNFGFLN